MVGSNNSRNFQDPSAAIRLLAADIKEQYATDPRRLYVTGLLGGARVASSHSRWLARIALPESLPIAQGCLQAAPFLLQKLRTGFW